MVATGRDARQQVFPSAETMSARKAAIDQLPAQDDR